MSPDMTLAELLLVLEDADRRRADRELTLPQRALALYTYNACIEEARTRGFDLDGLRAAVAHPET